MTVVNFKINKITAQRRDQNVKTIEVNANSTIVSMKKDYDKRIGDYVLVNYKYEIKYGPEVGEIILEGSLWYYSDKLADEIKEDKKEIEIKKEAAQEISTSIIRECIIESIDLVKKLYLPPPMQLPAVNVKAEQMRFKRAE
ncbi:MAG: hypothetical protein GF334_12125 [Candidatus Altiarchaeales archaeon]|nr:hypothetical protein [Candidatus Altiarchaeales archaeon]